MLPAATQRMVREAGIPAGIVSLVCGQKRSRSSGTNDPARDEAILDREAVAFVHHETHDHGLPDTSRSALFTLHQNNAGVVSPGNDYGTQHDNAGGLFAELREDYDTG